ncbi:MAG: glycosyltransferase family 4 protein, partial [Nanoarchaeota archaeon]
TETTSLATLEAMSSGLPVITTRVGFIKSYVSKNHNGIFFPRNNSTMLSVKIAKLLKDKELRDRLGQNARKTVAYGFSWERSINRIRRILLKSYYE